MRFINSDDKYHLSDQGANVFAADIRDVIDEALHLPKRNQYNNYRRGAFRGRYNNRYRGRGRGY